MEVLNGVVSKCMTCSHIRKSPVIASKTQLRFTNKGHLDYYGEAAKGKKGWNGVSTKKKIKLLENLTKDLSTLSDLGFGFNFDFNHINQASPPHHNYDDNNSIILSQAAQVLLAQLKQVRTEEKMLKKKEKEDKKKSKNSNCDSSSSESESSDSECGKVVDIKRLRNLSIVQPNETNDNPSLTTSSLPTIKGPTNELISLNLDQECNNMILEATLNKDAPIQVPSSKISNLKQSDMGKRIEVCMGGKCKKSGAQALLEELHKAIGDDGGVIGCKCMGKCKSAPNVKVSTGQTLADDSLRYLGNPLYIGVGLEDVELIVATYFGEEVKGLRMSIASAAS